MMIALIDGFILTAAYLLPCLFLMYVFRIG